jgi:hypothetical protein
MFANLATPSASPALDKPILNATYAIPHIFIKEKPILVIINVWMVILKMPLEFASLAQMGV